MAVTAREREKVSAFTRFNGSFVIENAPVGDYEIGVAASGYELLQKRIRIPSGRPLDGLDLRINRSAVITGRVLDEDGRAVVGATVEALQEQFLEGRLRWRDQSSRMTRFHGGFRTDDRGVYRIFGLPAGEYVIAVRPSEEPGLDGRLRFATAPGYFPNAGSLSGAARVTVEWGEEKQGIDVRLGEGAAYQRSRPRLEPGRAHLMQPMPVRGVSAGREFGQAGRRPVDNRTGVVLLVRVAAGTVHSGRAPV